MGPKTLVQGKAEYPGGGIPGSVGILRQATQLWTDILNLYRSTNSRKLFWYVLPGILCQREAVSSSWKWRPVIRGHREHMYLCIKQTDITWLCRLSMGRHTVSPAPVWVRIMGPKTLVQGKAEYPSGGIPRSEEILRQGTQLWTDILKLYYSTDSRKLFWYVLTGILCDLWSGDIHTLRYYYNYQYFCIEWH